MQSPVSLLARGGRPGMFVFSFVMGHILRSYAVKHAAMMPSMRESSQSTNRICTDCSLDPGLEE